MYYIVQENTFSEPNYDTVIKSLERLGLDYEIVKVLPHTDVVEYQTDRKDVFVFGSLKLARVSREQGWSPGSLMNENHDYEVYSKYYGENLLNHDSQVINFTDEITWDSLKFIRPCKDTKVFTGKVFGSLDWEEFVERKMVDGHSTILNENTKIQVSSVKKIQKEIRFWVVGGKVISGSQYRLGSRTVYDEMVEESAVEFCQNMVDKFQLADAFVMDVCLVDGQWKIVECGCINCAGFYMANLMKVIEALENFYEDN